ncbi:hypothetical protein SDC9_114254 [bioreactor metagenome]|uniref:NAD-specific glutamate dehydrogenase n=1 Tax=bioreactor metagenome TaxID=1076179 RepID=A0A645BQ56_9ZZZZ
MVADAFDGAGDGDDLDRRGDGARVFHHVGDQLADDRLEFGIDVAVGADHLLGLGGVEAGEGVERLAHQVERGFGQVADADAVLGRQMAGFVDAAHALGDLLGLVAGAFEIGDDLADAEHQAQVGSGRLALGDDVGAIVVDGLFQVVDLAVGFDDGFDAGHFARAVGVDGGRNLGFDHAAHLQDVGTQAAEFFVELAGEVLVFVHVGSPLAHAAGDVVFGALVVRLDEDFVGLAELDHLAQIHVGSVVGDTRCLLHVVGDDEDGDALLQFVHQFLDGAGGDRVERRGRLIEEQQFGVGGQGAGDAQTLLLAAGQVGGEFVQTVLDLVPQGAALERLLDLVVEDALVVLAAHAQAVGDVFVDALREGVRLLEDHADAHAHFDGVDFRRQQVGVVRVEADLALVAVAWVEVVHAVEAAQVGRFAAAGRADQCGDLLVVDRHVDVLQGLGFAVEEIEVAGFRLQRGLVMNLHG